MSRSLFRRLTPTALGLAFTTAAALVAVGSLATGTPAFASERPAGHIYTETNASSGNAIAVFDRAADGTLTAAGLVSTGGKGTGADLGDQGALAFSRDRHWLFAVNGGSDSISAFWMARNGRPVLVDVASSGGAGPVSVTEARGLVYVVNAGGSNISGFRLGHGGLTPLPGSSLGLSGSGVGPAEIRFALNGRILVVTEKGTNLIDVYRVAGNGHPTGPVTSPSSGQTPYGFSFSHGRLIVSEAFGGEPGASATSSYRLDAQGDLHPISASVPDGQTAACWLVIAGRYAFVTNTGTNNVSAYHIGNRGALTLVSGSAGSTGNAPQDMAVSRGGRYLYNINETDGSISAFRIGAGGTLTSIAGVGGLPTGSIAGLLAN
jgi:6-phosphogluconolactonase (cycloisomerase 2 family)